ncbi:FadR/GntR family transcriptional regulator [Arachnia propionica]|uniref:FadR family transcriptional regulator n=1 Tax=Arachnia propionica TaxID=1750 RepID=A0A3P1WW96_9ACTN|nr:FCD domain-containing protein [Arachnia propionica]RRD49680.1 FadR family transcriptional regulator [Arachnia propionica]
MTSVTAVETARRGLCRMIATGLLRCGDPLPSEAELCERFGVSRSSLREAQRMLTVAGALEARPGGRCTVSPMGPPQILHGLEMVFPLLPLDRYLELFPLREVLEGHAAAQAAARLTDEGRDRILDLAEQLAAVEPGDEAQRLDAEFHAAIVAGAEDPLIATLLGIMRRRGQDYRVFEEESHRDLKAISDEAHRRIATAIARRDAEGARFLAMAHVRETRTWLEDIRPGPVLFDQANSAPHS